MNLMKNSSDDLPLPENSSNSPSPDVSKGPEVHSGKVSRGTKNASPVPKRKSKAGRAQRRKTYRDSDRKSDIIRLDARVWKWASKEVKELLRKLQLSPGRKRRGSQVIVSEVSIDRAALLNRVQKIIDDLCDMPDLCARDLGRPVPTAEELSVTQTAQSPANIKGPVALAPAEICADPTAVLYDSPPADGPIDLKAVDDVPDADLIRPDTEKSAASAKTDCTQTDFGFLCT